MENFYNQFFFSNICFDKASLLLFQVVECYYFNFLHFNSTLNFKISQYEYKNFQNCDQIIANNYRPISLIFALFMKEQLEKR